MKGTFDLLIEITFNESRVHKPGAESVCFDPFHFPWVVHRGALAKVPGVTNHAGLGHAVEHVLKVHAVVKGCQ